MILVNGEVTENISVRNRGLAYGDGIFRTILVQNGTPLLWDRHYKKLHADCRAITIDCPSEPILFNELKAVSKNYGNCVVKILITRGVTQRGYKVENGPPTRIVMNNPLPDYQENLFEQGVKVRICDLRLGWQPKLAGVKHLNRLENVLACLEWNDPEIFEGLLLDCEANVIEGIMSNIFIIKENVMYTPDLSFCGVAGVCRDLIIDIARDKNIECNIARISQQDLLQSDEAFLCNSVMGTVPIKEMQGKVWNQNTYSKKFKQYLNA